MILTLVIVRKFAKNLPYEYKRRVSILHRNFDFRSTQEFELIEKYSCLISDYEIFKHDLYSDPNENIVCIAPIKKVFLNLINYVGCKTVMGHLLFCNRLIGDKNQCNHCTRMICFDHKNIILKTKILSKLNSMRISSLLVYAPQRTINIFKMSLYQTLKFDNFFEFVCR